MRLQLDKLAVFFLATSVSLGVSAANVVVTNSDDLTIVIKSGSTVQFDADGDLILECATVSQADNRCCTVVDGNQCVPLGTGGGTTDTTPPSTPTGLSATAVSTSQINLTWTASTDTGGSGLAGYRVERCQGASCSSNFTQIGTPSTNSLSSTGLSASTTYGFRVRAADGAGNLSGYSSIQYATTQTSGGSNACTVSGPLIAPAGMTRVDKTWSELFGKPFGCTGAACTGGPGLPPPTFPSGYGHPHPIGSVRNGYTVVPIDPTAGFTWNLSWDMAQTQSASNYSPARPALLMHIAISPCAGDLRPQNNASSDQFERMACRKLAQSSGLIYSTISGGVNQCLLTPGVRYYLTISPVSTTEGTPVDQCPGGVSTCEVQARSFVE